MASQRRLGDEETRRRDALETFEVLDTAPEREFDDLVRIASEACDAPIALVSLLDVDRQWFKAKIGLDPRETPLTSSICAHAVLQNDLFVIDDTTRDVRTAGNPLVTGSPHVRFYAGAPLRTAEGIALGTLCILDFRPRTLTPSQAFTLRTLARQVMTTLELRRALSEQRLAAIRHRESEQRLTLALRAGRMGSWQLDLLTGELAASDQCKLNFGRLVEEPFTYEALKAAVHPEDRERMLTAVETAIVTGADYDIEYRVIGPDGSEGWVMIRAQVVRGLDGEVERMSGISLDMTGRMLANMRNGAVFELGDRLRDLTDRSAIIAVAADVLSRAFRSDRACYAAVDLVGEVVTVEVDRCAPGFASVVGRHHVREYGSFFEQMKAGEVIAVDDVHDDPRCTRDLAAWARIRVAAFLNVPVMEQGRLVSVVVLHSEAPRHWTADEIDIARTIADRVRAALARAEAEEQRRLLNLELDHRMKNVLAIVQGVANQTLRTAPDMATAKSVLSGRLVALGRAHDFVFSGNTGLGTASLREVIDGALLPHRGEAHCIKTEGPALEITGKAALSVSLVTHELATNAVKYGALSVAGGHVEVRWSIQHVGADPVLRLNWLESGGPAVAAPLRKGFGTRLVERGLATVLLNQVTIDYDPAGFRCHFTGSLVELQADHSTLDQY